jgi:hypothetical protein
MTYMIYRVTQEHAEVGTQFLEDLETGEGLERGNPVIGARTTAIGQRGKRNRKDTLEDLEVSWKAYKAYKGIEEEAENPFLSDSAQDDLFSDQE